jgi:hypothetical protein
MSIITRIPLPPGPISVETCDQLLSLVIDELQWIRPSRFGHIMPQQTVPADEREARASLLDTFKKENVLEIDAQKGKTTLSIVPDGKHERTPFSYVAWRTSETAPALRLEAHRDGVARVMELLRAPLAMAAAEQAYRHFKSRRVPLPDIGGEEERPTVAGYHRGLEHPHWRMWFGAEYTEFLGREVLQRAPAGVSQPLDGIWFVQVLGKPEEWNQPSGKEAASRFASAVGKQVFYDPGDPERELEAPRFDI